MAATFVRAKFFCLRVAGPMVGLAGEVTVFRCLEDEFWGTPQRLPLRIAKTDINIAVRTRADTDTICWTLSGAQMARNKMREDQNTTGQVAKT